MRHAEWHIEVSIISRQSHEISQAVNSFPTAGWLGTTQRRERPRQLPDIDDSRLWNHHILDRYRVVQRVIEFVRLQHAWGREYIHRLRHSTGINRAVRIGADSSTDTEQERLRRRRKTARLIGRKTILTSQHYREPPA